MKNIHQKVEKALEKYQLQYKAIECDPELADTAAFVEAYGFTLEQSANTIIVASKGDEPKFACCVILGTTKLDVNKKVRELLQVKKLSFASAEQTIELTGMMIGGVVAIGVENMPIYIDSRVMDQPKVVMGGGNRSSKLVLNPQELTKLPNVEVIENLAKPKEQL